MPVFFAFSLYITITFVMLFWCSSFAYGSFDACFDASLNFWAEDFRHISYLKLLTSFVIFPVWSCFSGWRFSSLMLFFRLRILIVFPFWFFFLGWVYFLFEITLDACFLGWGFSAYLLFEFCFDASFWSEGCLHTCLIVVYKFQIKCIFSWEADTILSLLLS